MIAEDVVAIDDLPSFLDENKVGDAIGKESQFGGEEFATVIHAEVELPGAFGLQVVITLLEAEGAVVHTVAAQFTEVGSAESAGGIQAYIEVGRDVVDSSDATRDAIEVARELLEAHLPVFLQGITVEMAVVETESAADVEPFGNVFCCRGKDAEVEEMIGGNEELMAKVLRLLPHTVDSGIHGPSVPCRRHIAEIVVDGVKAEVLSHFVGGFIFLTAVLLVGQQSLDAAFANVEAVVKGIERV